MRPHVESRSICQRHVRARACLTPMHVGWGLSSASAKVSGNPNAPHATNVIPSPHPPAPRRLHWFYYVIPGGAWATLARTLDDLSSSNVLRAIQPSRFSNGFRARGSGMKRWPLRGRKEICNTAIAAQNSSPGFTEPTLPRKRSCKYRHCSARALSGLASFADRSTPLH